MPAIVKFQCGFHGGNHFKYHDQHQNFYNSYPATPVAVSVSNNNQTKPAANVYVKGRRNRMDFSTEHDFVNVGELVVYTLLNFIQ